jgi:hypothetical protein
MKVIEYDKHDGHIVLICKGQYKAPKELKLIEKLRIFHSFICGYDYNPNSTSIDEYIANRLFKIILKSEQINHETLQMRLHNEMCKNWRVEELTTPEFLINFYCSKIMLLNVSGENENQMILPEAKHEIFEKIFENHSNRIISLHKEL